MLKDCDGHSLLQVRRDFAPARLWPKVRADPVPGEDQEAGGGGGGQGQDGDGRGGTPTGREAAGVEASQTAKENCKGYVERALYKK